MNVLHYLVRHQGRRVSKDELIREVWDGTSVSDGAIVRSVAALRRILGDDATRPTYVQTLPKRGYVLVAPVEQESGPEPRRDRRRSFARATLAALAALLAIVALGIANRAGGRVLLLVEPFEELDATAQRERWADALSSELAAHFAGVGFGVVFSSDALAGQYGDAPTSVLRGSVRREGSRARVACSLSDARTARLE